VARLGSIFVAHRTPTIRLDTGLHPLISLPLIRIEYTIMVSFGRFCSIRHHELIGIVLTTRNNLYQAITRKNVVSREVRYPEERSNHRCSEFNKFQHVHLSPRTERRVTDRSAFPLVAIDHRRLQRALPTGDVSGNFVEFICQSLHCACIGSPRISKIDRPDREHLHGAADVVRGHRDHRSDAAIGW